MGGSDLTDKSKDTDLPIYSGKPTDLQVWESKFKHFVKTRDSKEAMIYYRNKDEEIDWNSICNEVIHLVMSFPLLLVHLIICLRIVWKKLIGFG